MPKGYVIMTEVIRDPAGMGAYAQAARPSIHDHDAAIVVVERSPDVLEGEWPADQTVILEFESVEAARAWYDSPSYQEAMGLRHAAADTNAVILAGFERPTT